MSENRPVRGSGPKHPGVGVTNLSPMKGNYVPKLHNPSSPLRPGSQDAFDKPSMDINGEPIPYWGNK